MFKNNFKFSKLIYVSILVANNIYANDIHSPTTNVGAVESLEQLIQIAVNNNAKLKSNKIAWNAMLEQRDQVEALTDPKFVYSESIQPIETRLGPLNRSLSLTQKFPFPGKLGLKGKVLNKDVEVAKIKYDKLKTSLIADVKQLFYELYYLNKAIKLKKQNQQILKKITQLTTTNYAVNSSTLDDISKEHIQYAKISYDVKSTIELIDTKKTSLNSLLNRNPEYKFTINPSLKKPKKIIHSLKHLYSLIPNNEDIKIYTLYVQQNELKRELSDYTNLPDFSLGVKYNQIGERKDIEQLKGNGTDAISISLSLNIPLNLTKNNSIKREFSLKKRQSIEEKNAFVNQMHSKIKLVLYNINTSYDKANLYNDVLIPKASDIKETAEIRYSSNQISTIQYLKTELTWINFNLEYQRSIADYWINIAKMEKLVGKL